MSNSSESEHQVCSQYDNPTANSDIGRVMITLTVFTGGFGIFGNIFIIVLAVKYTVRRSLHHLIISMAAADILVALATFGLWIIESLFEQKWSNIYQSVLCSSMSFFLLLGMWTTFVSLLIITVGRFRATRTTTRRSKPSTQKQRIVVLFFSWTTALLLASGEIVFKRDNLISDFSETFQNGIGSVVHSLVFGTYCAIFVLNFLTLKRLSNNGAIENSIPEAQRKVRQKRMSSAIKMVLCSQFLYTCCYLPYDLEGFFVSLEYHFKISQEKVKFFSLWYFL